MALKVKPIYPVLSCLYKAIIFCRKVETQFSEINFLLAGYLERSATRFCRQGANVIKPFTAVIYEWSLLAILLVPGRRFQPSLIFVGKAISLPKKTTTYKCSTKVGFGLTHKYYTRLETPVRDKH